MQSILSSRSGRRGLGPAPRFVRASLAPALLAGCLAVGAARPGHSSEALYLTWNDCARNGAGASNLDASCASNAGINRLFCAFTLGAPLDSVVGIEAVVDYQTQVSPLPNWWRFGPGDCRAGSLNASQDFTGDTTCADFWNNAGVAIIQGFTAGSPRGGTNQARVLAVASLPSNASRSLDATHMYYAVEVTIDNAGTDFCGGCLSPACLVLNSIWLRRLPGVAGGDILLQSPAPGGGNLATWLGDGPADCLAVPARRTTWGQLKSLYR